MKHLLKQNISVYKSYQWYYISQSRLKSKDGNYNIYIEILKIYRHTFIVHTYTYIYVYVCVFLWLYWIWRFLEVWRVTFTSSSSSSSHAIKHQDPGPLSQFISVYCKEFFHIQQCLSSFSHQHLCIHSTVGYPFHFSSFLSGQASITCLDFLHWSILVMWTKPSMSSLSTAVVVANYWWLHFWFGPFLFFPLSVSVSYHLPENYFSMFF